MVWVLSTVEYQCLTKSAHKFAELNIETLGIIGSMQIFLILLASALFGECATTTIHAIAGEDVLLSCSCPQETGAPYVVWQINDTVVAYYIPEYDIKYEVDPQFRGRTHLFLSKDTGNCSLQLANVTKADEETYTCHYTAPEHTMASLTLQVSPRPELTKKIAENEKHEVVPAISGVVLSVAVLLAAFLTLRYRERCRCSQVDVPGSQEPEQTDPLNPV